MIEPPMHGEELVRTDGNYKRNMSRVSVVKTVTAHLSRRVAGDLNEWCRRKKTECYLKSSACADGRRKVVSEGATRLLVLLKPRRSE